jgi:hypothetical protein
MVSDLSTERIENCSAINGRFEFQSLPLPRLILRKVRRFGRPKTTQYQLLTSSVLNPRSPELWRKTATERKFDYFIGASQSGGLRANAVFIGHFYGLGNQRRMFNADRLAEGVYSIMR